MGILILTYFVTLVGFALPQEDALLVLPLVELEMPVTISPKEPAHGTCYNNTALTCPTAGASLAPDVMISCENCSVNPCLDCVCSPDNVVYCCRRKSEPTVNNPEKCKLTQDQKTCEFHMPRCKGCKITGWQHTILPPEIEECFANVTEGGLSY